MAKKSNNLVKEDKKDTDTSDSLSLIYSITNDALETLRLQKNSIESKANALTGFAGGMFALLIGARETILLLETTSQIMILVSIALFILSVILNNMVVWVRHYRNDPDPEMFAKHYLSKNERDTKLQLTSNLIGAWKNNKKIVENNGIKLRLSFIFQAIAFILLGIVLFISIF